MKTIMISVFLLASASFIAQDYQITQQVFHPNQQTNTDTKFGHAVAMFGKKVAISAHLEDNPTLNEGAVYLFNMIGDTIDQTSNVKLTPQNAVAQNAQFGTSLAMDNNWLAVGAPHTGSAVEAGKVFLYDNTNTEHILSDGNINSTSFGYSVAIEDDYLVVGAIHYDDQGNQATSNGIAYVYKWSGSSWALIKNLKPEDGSGNPNWVANDKFGYSVAISGDHIIVGAPFTDTDEAGDGKAYVYEKNTGGPDNWGQEQILTPVNDGFPGDQFGYSVAIEGNITAIGSPLKDLELSNNIYNNLGKVSVYEKNGSGTNPWSMEFNDFTPAWEESDRTGHAVAISKEIIFSLGETAEKGTKEPGIYNVLEKDNGSWSYTQSRVFIDPSYLYEQDHIESVAFQDSVAIVGSPRWDTGPSYEKGAVYVIKNMGGIAAGVAELTETNAFNVYPNPSNGIITIQTATLIKDFQLTIYNNLGAKVANFTPLKNKVELDLNPFGKGIYMVAITTKDGASSMKKVMIQ